jgi:hypothetical protein
MKEIPLTRGYVAFVSDADYERVSQRKWQAQVSKKQKQVYAQATIKDQKVLLHRFILGITDPLVFVDHRDGNGLNCQRDNLRPCNNGQNVSNQPKRVGTAGKYKGVYSHYGKWQAQISYRMKIRSLGTFKNEEDAARAYDAAARSHYGEFARCNFPLAEEL